jgi:hypothetical protein
VANSEAMMLYFDYALSSAKVMVEALTQTFNTKEQSKGYLLSF